MSDAVAAPRIDSSDLTLAEVFKDFYSVPDFQREYVWEEENVERLLDDVYDEVYDEKGNVIDKSEYFIGSIVVYPDGVNTFRLIDGQQRLTTCFLLLCAARDRLQSAEGKDGCPKTTLDQIYATTLDLQTGRDVPRYRLSLQYQDSEAVLDRIASATVPVDKIRPTTASVRHILQAYRAITVFLDTHFPDGDSLRKFLAQFGYRVKLIRIRTPNMAHALKVFETINDRGVGLNAMDLLKNLLFMKARQQDYPVLKDKWKHLVDTLDGCREKPLRFLRYYVMSHYEIDARQGVREDELFAWLVDKQDSIGITTNPLGFMDGLIEAAEAYARFLSARDAQGNPNRYLANIAALSGSARQHFILLLAGRHLAQQQFDRLASALEDLFFCYVITREPTKSFERSFARWAVDLRSVRSDNELTTFLETHFRPDLSARARAFRFAFTGLAQDSIQQYRMRYILAKLTQYVDQQAWGGAPHADIGPYLAAGVQVEHVLPQNPAAGVREAFDRPDLYDSYVRRLGNLTLLEQTINDSVSNAGYALKKQGFKQSKFLLTRSLVEEPRVGARTALNRAVERLQRYDIWDSHAIEARQEVLTELAFDVWHIPHDESSAEVPHATPQTPHTQDPRRAHPPSRPARQHPYRGDQCFHGRRRPRGSHRPLPAEPGPGPPVGLARQGRSGRSAARHPRRTHLHPGEGPAAGHRGERPCAGSRGSAG